MIALAVVVLMMILAAVFRSGSVIWMLPIIIAVGFLISRDKHGASIESFFAGCFGLIVIGGAAAGLIQLFR